MTTTRTVIALGFFDGVHRAHGALLNRVTQRSRELDALPCAFTFDQHPSVRLCRQADPLINGLEDRRWLMERYYGIQKLLIASFDQMMHMDWEDFITEYLIKEQGAVHVVCGDDFHFGAKGKGNPQRLLEKCRQLGIGCDIISQIELEGIRVSSTHIRSLLAQGNMEEANVFLGHPHTLSNRVTPGKKLGHTLGFPTVNLAFPAGVIVPSHGVYTTKVLLEDGRELMAVTNIGVRPTVEQTMTPNVEGFILDYDGDLYGQMLRMEFYHKLRGEQRFPSVEALTEEVMRNAQQTRDYFAQHRG